MGSPIVSNIGAYLAEKAGNAPALAGAGTRNSTGFDRTGFSSCVLVAMTGAVAGAPSAQTLDAKIQDSADNSTFADYKPDGVNVASIPQITAANSIAYKNVNLEGARQYIRVVETAGFTGGTSPTIGAAEAIILGGAVTKPAS